jgi:ATP-dependent DNA helicase Q4
MLSQVTNEMEEGCDVKDDADGFISDDILSQITEEQMIDKTADVGGGVENPPDELESCQGGENVGSEEQCRDVGADSSGDKKSLGNQGGGAEICPSHSEQERNNKNENVDSNCSEGGNQTKEAGEPLVDISESDSDEVKTINEDESKQTQQEPERRACGGHEVAIATESAVQELDMPEESISTLLCYLELHTNRWLELLRPVKCTCTVKFYGGHAHLRAVAKRIPPIAAAVAYCEKKETKFKKQSSLSFPVVEIADKMGWDLDPVVRELRALQWNSSLAPDSKLSSSGQSGILVEFEDNSMHIRAPGDLNNEERDEVCDFLDDRIQAEERTQIKQLSLLHSSLRKVSCAEYWQCSEEIDKDDDQELKTLIKAYFNDMNNATQIELDNLKKRRENDACDIENPHDEHVNWDGIARDIRGLTGIHHDQMFTGRAVARIFHGISSPGYPAVVWGRDRRFWRKNLDVDFNSLRKFATRELLNLR